MKFQSTAASLWSNTKMQELTLMKLPDWFWKCFLEQCTTRSTIGIFGCHIYLASDYPCMRRYLVHRKTVPTGVGIIKVKWLIERT